MGKDAEEVAIWARAAASSRALTGVALGAFLLVAVLFRLQGMPTDLPVAAQAPAIIAKSPTPGADFGAPPLDGGFQALNPAQHLKERFSRSGVVLSTTGLNVGVAIAGLGYGRSIRPLPTVRPRRTAEGIVYSVGRLNAWYLNRPRGLEQGFTVPRAPARTPPGPLTVSLALSGSAHATLASDGRTVTFSTAAHSLRYGDLLATDSKGHTLRSWLELRGRRLLLRVKVRHAGYPVRIDPLIQEAARLTSAGAEGPGLFGASVALAADGNTALVGAPLHGGHGAVTVFTRVGSSWAPQGPPLTGSLEGGEELVGGCEEEPEEGGEEAAACGFGYSVALSGDGGTALVGAPLAGSGRGAVWVFTRTGSTWTQQGPPLTGGREEGVGGHFGRSVAVSADGDTAAIGAPAEKAGRGAVWVFTRTGSAWTQQGPSLTGEEDGGERRFGRGVALSADGDAVLIGAPADASGQGAVWVYARSGASWSRQGEKLTGSQEEGQGRFGFNVAVAADGSTAIVGGRHDGGGRGAVWWFTSSAGHWTPQGGKLTASGESGNGEFGRSVALSANGETALIGAPADANRGGSAWELTRSGSTWVQAPEALAGSQQSARSRFGSSVALSALANTALIGGPFNEDKAGAAWAFAELPVATLPPSVTKVTPNSGPGTGGSTVTIAGTSFTAATAVDFGTTRAASYTVHSATSITAVSPGGVGTVDVTVTTPAGTSATSPRDRYVFEGATSGPYPEPGSGTDPGSSTGPGSGTVATLEVRGFTTARRPAPCHISLASAKLPVLGYRRAALRLLWKGKMVCRGRLQLKASRKSHGRTTAKIIGTSAFSIRPGAVRTAWITLNATGRMLLKAGHGRLRASLAVLDLTPGPAKSESAIVRLARAQNLTRRT